jgi:pimeloyl-ACP methyl ester carboxylesterase
LAAVGPAIAGVVAGIERGDAEGAAHRFVDEVAFGPGAWDELPVALRETMIAGAPAFLAEQRDPARAALEPTKVTAPVLLTQGDDGPEWFRLVVARLADAIPQARVHTYAGAGHAPHATHPEAFVRGVESFLARVGEPVTLAA